jgi:hypothetical protein
MTTTTKTHPLKAEEATMALEKKWGKTLISAGFTALPNVIFQSQNALGLKPLDVLVLLHLASYWWRPMENPRPAKGDLAASLNVDPRTVQRSISKMEGLGYLKRIQRRASDMHSLTNEYDMRGLVHAPKVKELAMERIELKAQRTSESKKRAADERARTATPKSFAAKETTKPKKV